MKKNNKGFSLVELIVVVLILGILAVAVTPQIMTWIDKSHAAKDESYAGTVSSAIEAVALEYIGEGKQDEISPYVKITSGDLACYKADKTTADPGNFENSVDEVFGATKCVEPSQNDLDFFWVAIEINSTNKTVSVTTVATK